MAMIDGQKKYKVGLWLYFVQPQRMVREEEISEKEAGKLIKQ